MNAWTCSHYWLRGSRNLSLMLLLFTKIILDSSEFGSVLLQRTVTTLAAISAHYAAWSPSTGSITGTSPVIASHLLSQCQWRHTHRFLGIKVKIFHHNSSILGIKLAPYQDRIMLIYYVITTLFQKYHNTRIFNSTVCWKYLKFVPWIDRIWTARKSCLAFTAHCVAQLKEHILYCFDLILRRASMN